MKYTEMSSRLFRFYHSETISALTTEPGREILPQERAHTQDILSTYLQTVMCLATQLGEDTARNTDLNGLLLQMVERAGFESYAHIAVLMLLQEARGSLTLSAKFKVESPSLHFARSLLLRSIEVQGSLVSVQNLLLCLCSLPLSAGTLEHCDSELQILEPELVSEALVARTWLSSKGLVSVGKEARSLRYIVLFCLQTWLDSDASFQGLLSSIAGSEPSVEIQEQFYTIYLVMGLMKGEVSLFLQQKEYKKETKPFEAKQSAKRLSSRVDSLQDSFNAMLSHDIHSSIVLKIMRFPADRILGLKTNSLQLLLQKTPDFEFQLSAERRGHMLELYEPLIEQAFKFLKSKTTEKELPRSSDM